MDNSDTESIIDTILFDTIIYSFFFLHARPRKFIFGLLSAYLRLWSAGLQKYVKDLNKKLPFFPLLGRIDVREYNCCYFIPSPSYNLREDVFIIEFNFTLLSRLYL